MGRAWWLLLVAVLAVLAVACAGSSSAPHPSRKLESGDVALVGSVHLTKSQLAHQVKLELRSFELGYESCKGGTSTTKNDELCSTKKVAVPRVGTAAYRTAVIEPVVEYLVTTAELHQIGRRLSVVVTPPEVTARVRQDFQQLYGGDEAKYRADLNARGLTEADVRQQVELTLLQQKIKAKLERQVTVTPADMLAYFNSHRQVYETAAATRRVDYVLESSRAAAIEARAAIRAGKTFADVARGAIDDSSLHPPFVATKGQTDKVFQAAAFGLSTNALSPILPVDRTYADSSLRGKCTPTCYFIVRPTARVVKAGTRNSFESVKATIKAQLLSMLRTRHVNAVIAAFAEKYRKLVRYAPGYAPR